MGAIQASVDRMNASQRELAQSASRPSRVRFVVTVAGAGETRMGESLVFGTFFLSLPSFAYGCILDQPIRDGEFPLATAVVESWEVNDRGMYTAANMLFRVDSVRTDIRLTFTLTFEGFALRTIAPFQSER